MAEIDWHHPMENNEVLICDYCEQPVKGEYFAKMYYFWPHKNFVLCVDCLDSLHESIFGLSTYNRVSYQKRPIPEKLRQKIYERDKYTCQYCGAKENLSVDHIRPEKYGGTLVEENLVTACRPCNSKKGSRTLEESNMCLIKDPRF